MKPIYIYNKRFPCCRIEVTVPAGSFHVLLRIQVKRYKLLPIWDDTLLTEAVKSDNGSYLSNSELDNKIKIVFKRYEESEEFAGYASKMVKHFLKTSV